MSMSSEQRGYEPSYREADIDETLDEHHRRIKRLEKAALFAGGYGLAKGTDLITAVFSVIPL